jgi:tripeptidyl-peptidase-1
MFLKHAPGAEEQLEQVLMEVSDPRSIKYGQHLSNEQLAQLMTSPHATKQLSEWLTQHNVPAQNIERTLVGDMWKVRLSVRQAEAMFQTSLKRYSMSFGSTDHSILRATSYTIPSQIADAVSLVGDLIHFPAEPRRPIRVETTGRRLLGGGGKGTWDNSCTGTGGSKCKGLVEPGVLKKRYNLPSAPTVASNSTVAVAEFQGQYYKDSDVSSFSTACAVSPAVKVARNVGENKDTAGIESELDIEFIGAVSNPIPLTVWYQAEYSLLSWVQSVMSNSEPGHIHSVSYGNDEIQQTSTAYMQQVNTQFMQAGAKGISILFASGDQGVWGRSGHGSKFHPDFPGASPYITAVGGTDFTTYAIGDETAWDAGGGGFSDTFAQPSWQSDAVKGYLASKDADLPPASFWNASGRAYPDVAALGGQKTPYCVATGGRFEGVAGTSASCPVVAGVFGLLNNVRLAAGKPPLGFLNPFIYQNGAAFNDVTSGKNNAGSGNGFTAVKGWDAATGFGTPDYEKLLAAVKALP